MGGHSYFQHSERGGDTFIRPSTHDKTVYINDFGTAPKVVMGKGVNVTRNKLCFGKLGDESACLDRDTVKKLRERSA